MLGRGETSQRAKSAYGRSLLYVVDVHEAISGHILQQIVEEDVEDETTETEHENKSGFSNPLQDSGVALVNGAAEQRRRRCHRPPSQSPPVSQAA